MNDLSTVQSAALSKVGGAVSKVEPGKYDLDFTVRIKGTLTKGEDYPQAIWPSIPVLGLCFRAMNEAGVFLGKRRVKALVKSILDGDKTSGELIDEKELKGWVKEAIQELAEKATKTCSGKTTAKLVAEAILPEAVETEIVTMVEA